MAIYQLFDEVYDPSFKGRSVECSLSERRHSKKIEPISFQEEPCSKGSAGWFSGIVSRVAFLFLLVLDLGWLVFNAVKGLSLFILHILYKKKRDRIQKALVNCRRALVCAAALFLGLFSPSFGLLVAWTYFSSYDKQGLVEVIPQSIREHIESLSKAS